MPLPVTQGYGSSGVGTAFVLNSVSPFDGYVELNMSNTPVLNGPAAVPSNWGLSAIDGGYPAQVTAVSTSGSKVILTVSQQTNGKTYLISVPPAGIVDVAGNAFSGSFSPTFVAVAAGPTVEAIKVVDELRLAVTFSKAVDASDAASVAHYSISPFLGVRQAAVVGALQVNLTTDKQIPLQVYTLTVSNVHDLAGNVA